jgi:uncharacterized protein YaaN involved in tellurite resistance
MPNSDAELAVVQERLKNLDSNLHSIFSKIDKISETILSINDKLDGRMRILETENGVQKSQIDDLLTYKTTSDTRIKELENIKSYYKGVIAVIIFLIVASGVLGFMLKGYFPPPP